MKYEEIFEREARWLMGPRLLTDVVNYLKGKCLVAERVPGNPNACNIIVPLPTIQNDLTGEEVSIAEMVPLELLRTFWGCLNEAISDYLGDAGLQELSQYIGQPNTMFAMSNIQTILRDMEYKRRAEDELWAVVAKHFGIYYLNLSARIILR